MKKATQSKSPKDPPRGRRAAGAGRSSNSAPPGASASVEGLLDSGSAPAAAASPVPDSSALVPSAPAPTASASGASGPRLARSKSSGAASAEPSTPPPPVPRASILAHVALVAVAWPLAGTLAESLGREGFPRELIRIGAVLAACFAFELRRRAGSGSLPGAGMVALARRSSRAAWTRRAKEVGLPRATFEFERGAIERSARAGLILPTRVAAGFAFACVLAGGVASSLEIVSFFAPLAALALAWERVVALSPRALAPMTLAAARASAARARSRGDLLIFSRVRDFLLDAALLGAFAIGWRCLHIPVEDWLRGHEESGKGLAPVLVWSAWPILAAIVGFLAGIWMARCREAFAERERAELAEALRDSLADPD